MHKRTLLIVSILIPLLIGLLACLFSMNGMLNFDTVNKPSFAPPAILFPIIWTILYVLMGYSSYVVMQSETIECKYTALGLYSLQLFVNFLWTIMFFAFKAYLIAFITLIVLWSLIIFMLIHFKRISRASFWLNIPYLLWITFAGYLNLEIVFLN